MLFHLFPPPPQPPLNTTWLLSLASQSQLRFSPLTSHAHPCSTCGVKNCSLVGRILGDDLCCHCNPPGRPSSLPRSLEFLQLLRWCGDLPSGHLSARCDLGMLPCSWVWGLATSRRQLQCCKQEAFAVKIVYCAEIFLKGTPLWRVC